MTNQTQIAIFGGGCFWCTEAIFAELKGVISVMPGYAGGPPVGGDTPTYEQVCGGDTGHAEAIEVKFDPTQINYNNLLTVFFATHDPMTLNKQGNDIGTQYRSIILYTSEAQKEEAEKFIEELNKKGQKVVTELKPLDKFYPAEEYHRQYFKKNPEKAYCQAVISPKLEKLRQKFEKLLK